MLKEARKLNSAYVMLLEDDFPICDGKLPYLYHSLCRSVQRDPNSCGFFASTGGNSLILRRGYSLNSAINELQNTLKNDWKGEEESENAHDIQLQECLEGKRNCPQCKNHFFISPILYFYHIGKKSSTMGRKFINNPWQCDWRHVSELMIHFLAFNNFKKCSHC